MSYINYNCYHEYLNPFVYNLKRINECYKQDEKFAFRYESELNNACKNNYKFQNQYFKHLLNCDFTTLELGLFNYIKRHSNITKQSNNINTPKYHIKDILSDHFDKYLEVMNNVCVIPDYVIKNVNKTIICKTKELGCDFYCCPECGNTYLNFHTCKSRFCASCGVKYAKDRVIEIQKKVFDCPHRHIVFTIPKELREYFKKDKSLLNILFIGASDVINYFFNGRRESKRVDKSKSYTITPGFISVLHTFGRDLKWNPHIHMLISEGGIDSRTSSFKNVNYFNYNLLRKSWQKIILDALTSKLGKSFYPLRNMLYNKLDNGFYVYAPREQFDDTKKGIEYVVRYTGRPVMSESRITNYDGTMVTWYYHPHEDETKTITVVKHAYKFISKLIQHIPKEQFKTVRYYGAYAAKNHRFRKHKRMYNKNEIITNIKLNKWRNSILFNFGYDKLECSRCQKIMIKEYSVFTFFKKGVKVSEEIKFYEKTKNNDRTWCDRTGYCPTYW